ncbi:signal peptidase I [Opitutus sp. ER46]|uniref:signal peptidase I n=1 Tax=Opitutus sp. ER46 TaxID=2161864 RepID=UPI000D31461E|nr:signal peptidase I [Opitutus sp. ER46]PTY00669.1 signal peptidase I [Opitutus sp. ER46]
MNARRVATYVWREWIRPLALPLLLITAAKSALADINYIPSGSMHPTLVEGDVVFVNKLAYDLRVPFTFTRLNHWADPARGDVVVCFEPTEGTRLVKRVVGLPGDRFELRGDAVFVNGVRQAYAPLPPSTGNVLEPAERATAVFVREELAGRSHPMMVQPDAPALRNFGPLTLAPGQYIVLGDNRDNSRDSRFFGVMPRERIIGRVHAVVLSADYHHWLRPRLDRTLTLVP